MKIYRRHPEQSLHFIDRNTNEVFGRLKVLNVSLNVAGLGLDLPERILIIRSEMMDNLVPAQPQSELQTARARLEYWQSRVAVLEAQQRLEMVKAQQREHVARTREIRQSFQSAPGTAGGTGVPCPDSTPGSVQTPDSGDRPAMGL